LPTLAVTTSIGPVRTERRVHFLDDFVSKVYVVPRDLSDEIARGDIVVTSCSDCEDDPHDRSLLPTLAVTTSIGPVRKERRVHFLHDFVSKVHVVPRDLSDDSNRKWFITRYDVSVHV